MTWQRHSGGNAGHGRLGGEKVIRNQALTALLGVGPIPSSSKGPSKGVSKDPTAALLDGCLIRWMGRRLRQIVNPFEINELGSQSLLDGCLIIRAKVR